MAIEFTNEPLWRFGSHATQATPMQSLAKKFYSLWDSSHYPIYSAMSTPGWYIITIRNLSGNSFWRSGQTQSGCYPRSWVGPDDYVADTRVTMSLTYPTAKRRFEILQTIAQSGSSWTINWQSRWINTETEAVDTSMTYPGWSTSAGWINNGDGRGTPGSNIISYQLTTDQTLIGFTTNGWQVYDDSYGAALTAVGIDAKVFTDEIVSRYGNNFKEFESEEVSPEAGPASQQDGYAPHGSGMLWQTDTVGLPPMPDISICDLGFVNMYAPQAADLTDLGEEIFPDLDWQTVTGIDVVDAILNTVAMIPDIVTVFINSRLIDYVQDIHVVPFPPVTSGTGPIKLGFRTLNIICPIVTTDYVEVDLGEIDVDECFTQFLDYQPYTQAKLYLPFIGFVPVEPEWFQKGKLKVVYRASVRDGSFMCFVLSNPARGNYSGFQVVGEYAGNACIHAPITGLNYSSMVAGLIGGASAAVGAVNAGNPAAAAMAALNTAAAAPQVQSSNGFTGQAAFMGGRYPFLMITRTVPHYPASYQHDKGLPSRITTNLGGARGFVTVKDADLSGIQATEAEKDEIRKLLADGIYVN